MTAPQYPVGPEEPEDGYGRERRDELTAQIERMPADLRAAVAGLADARLDTRYKNWTVRQIAHHLADSHMNAYIRFKLALTEDVPTIKPYNEGRWSELAEAAKGNVAPSLALLDALHERWARLLRSMSDADFARTYYHPGMGQTVTLSAALSSYAWHGRHHTGQILWLCGHHGWGGA